MKQEEQLTKEQALELAHSGVWKNWTLNQRAERQIMQKRLFMDYLFYYKSHLKLFYRI